MIALRKADVKDLSTVLDWAAAEGWNPGLDDAPAILAADPDGFFVATEGDTPIASISVVNHNDRFSFLGLYIVRPEYRGKGIGLSLWQHALKHAETRTIGLDGVPAQQENYRQSGFAHAGETARFAGNVSQTASMNIEAAGDGDIPRLIEMEASASGARKEAYLSTWFAGSRYRKTLVRRSGEQISGFCTVRQCRDGAKIGPLLAGSVAEAEELMRHAAGCFDSDIVIDVPAISVELGSLCRDMGLTRGFETARMYRGAFVAPRPTLFAVTSLELG